MNRGSPTYWAGFLFGAAYGLLMGLSLAGILTERFGWLGLVGGAVVAGAFVGAGLYYRNKSHPAQSEAI